MSASKHKGVMASFVHYRGLPMMFVHSLLKSVKAGAISEITEHSSARINAARTANGHAFLESDCEWIFLVDTDMVWEPAELIRLVQFAKKNGAKAVSGWTLMPKDKTYWPHAFRLHGDNEFIPYGHIAPFSEPIKVEAVGGACFLVHREVMEKVKENYTGSTEYVWQEEVYNPAIDANRGEDIEFSRRIREAGYDIWYHPGAIFAHIKDMPIGPDQYNRWFAALQQAMQAGEYEVVNVVEDE